MTSPLLTPEEIRAYSTGIRTETAVAHAQLVAVVKWLEEPCLIHHHEEGEVTKHMDCPECWQYLKGLVK